MAFQKDGLGEQINITIPFLTLGMLVFLAGCSGSGSTMDVPEREVTPVDVSRAGTITGRTFYREKTPPPKAIRVSGNPECSGLRHGPVFSEELLVDDGRLQNCFVYIKSGLGGRVFAIPDESIEVDNRRCVYEPHVVGVQRYQQVRFMNSDPTLHNINIFAKNSRSWNIGLPSQGMRRELVFPEEEVMIRLKCDVHPWMTAYLGVVDHPFFAVTGTDGGFSFSGVPPGTYTVAAWHETLGALEREVTLDPKGKTELNFEF